MNIIYTESETLLSISIFVSINFVNLPDLFKAMAISSSRKRCNLKRVDRISGLPDHLLCRILAFLPTRSAMATSVLSRRWEYVWTGVPVLNFTYDQDVILEKFFSIAAKQQYQSLKYYMNRVLLHNNAACLERVDFAIFPVMTEKDRQKWFKVLSRRSVNEVNLFYEQCCSVPITFLLDGPLGKNLVALRLECEHEYTLDVAFNSTVHLPCLEKVHLSRVKIYDDCESLTSLIRCSPRLRELNILECEGVLNFSCSSLKILKLSAIQFITGSITVPNLEYFELSHNEIFHDDDDCHFLTGDMPYLAEAKVDYHMKVAMWGDFFQTMRHVIKLDISINPCINCALQENTTVDLKLPYFNRLKCLDIHCYEEHSIRQTRMFLRHMPNCVSLIIHMSSSLDSSNFADMKGWPDVDSSELELSVEYIEIDGFGPNRLVSVELLKYLLGCCTRLKEMKLRMCIWWGNRKQKNAMRKRVVRLSRQSGCKIVIDDPGCELT